MQDEGIVYLARKLGWSLDKIGKLTPSVFRSILEETQFQESMEEWRADARAGAIMAMIINCTPRKDKRQYKATDFCGHPPRRANETPGDAEINLAKSKGLKVPKFKAERIET